MANVNNAFLKSKLNSFSKSPFVARNTDEAGIWGWRHRHIIHTISDILLSARRSSSSSASAPALTYSANDIFKTDSECTSGTYCYLKTHRYTLINSFFSHTYDDERYAFGVTLYTDIPPSDELPYGLPYLLPTPGYLPEDVKPHYILVDALLNELNRIHGLELGGICTDPSLPEFGYRSWSNCAPDGTIIYGIGDTWVFNTDYVIKSEDDLENGSIALAEFEQVLDLIPGYVFGSINPLYGISFPDWMPDEGIGTYSHGNSRNLSSEPAAWDDRYYNPPPIGEKYTSELNSFAGYAQFMYINANEIPQIGSQDIYYFYYYQCTFTAYPTDENLRYYPRKASFNHWVRGYCWDEADWNPMNRAIEYGKFSNFGIAEKTDLLFKKWETTPEYYPTKVTGRRNPGGPSYYKTAYVYSNAQYTVGALDYWSKIGLKEENHGKAYAEGCPFCSADIFSINGVRPLVTVEEQVYEPYGFTDWEKHREFSYGIDGWVDELNPDSKSNGGRVYIYSDTSIGGTVEFDQSPDRDVPYTCPYKFTGRYLDIPDENTGVYLTNFNIAQAVLKSYYDKYDPDDLVWYNLTQSWRKKISVEYSELNVTSAIDVTNASDSKININSIQNKGRIRWEFYQIQGTPFFSLDKNSGDVAYTGEDIFDEITVTYDSLPDGVYYNILWLKFFNGKPNAGYNQWQDPILKESGYYFYITIRLTVTS